jgi:hypothetical protein
MTQQPPPQPGAAPLSLVQRFVGILFSPKPTFASVVSYPRWLGMMLISTYLAVGAQFAFTSTEVGRQAALDQQIEMTSRFTTVTPEMEANMRQAMEKPAQRAIPLIAGPIFGLLFTAVIAGLLFGVFAATGGTASFKQVMAVVAHAGVISGVLQVLLLPVWFLRGSMSSATNLGVFWPGDESSFIARFLGTLDLVWVWYLFVLAVGLAVLYRRRTQAIFVSLLGVFVVIAGLIAGVMTAFGGS